MANANSTTTTRPEIICPSPVSETAITQLLKTPLGANLDLFQVLDCCQYISDALIENSDHTECMALYGRLYAGLEVLKVVLKVPLPAYLIERLTVDAATEEKYHCPLSTDSESMREYCAALTMLLLQRQQSPEQEEQIGGLLFELLNVLIEDLKAPRFIRSEAGLMMISDDTKPDIH
ncbi:hypothetical protein MUA02_13590 [Enterobacteriaceae bacterium H20N1]|uniref:Uncharacterized protein n=1 Tax=Dryocola boscaweniae TaxID=2925397 RepID=A0A9X2W8Z1_9ENTR|nr:hypothetical protein [Dryocola boscaweniae]MCT4702887.1 hypothetical protein [Dryocola boscaweniae]MCT4720055.1 hypothetical protein [Dryocola boscaweniae]